MRHELKIKSKYFNELLSGTKTFEIRKNDRDFKEGDTLKLNEYKDDYTGSFITADVVGIMYDDEGLEYGLQKGYCLMSLSLTCCIL